ncbi:hypothetical protein [Flavicella sp.]|uniref:hypothetical protein n=1 Tax=Flavicella sp. TaxID=2957742 RepID=UPI0030166EF7
MKKLVALVIIFFTFFAQAQNENEINNKIPEEAKKINQVVIPATSTQVIQPKETTPAQSTQTTQKAKHENEKKSAIPFVKKLYFGGTFGATFGNYTSITIAPTIGYRLRPSLYTGVKFYYTYSKQKFGSNSYEYHNYGIGTFLRWFAFSDIYLHVAPEAFSYEQTTIANQTSREWVPYLWAGAGIRKRVSNRSWISVHVLFDMINDKNSPYDQWEPNLVIGAGTSF